MCGSRACLASSAVGLLLLFLLAGLSGCAALFSDEGPVPIIGENDFEIAVQQSPVPVLVFPCSCAVRAPSRPLPPLATALATPHHCCPSLSANYLQKFFVDIDGHCRELAEPYAEAAGELQGVVPFLSVRCQNVDDPPFCARFNIKRFPTIHMYKPGEQRPQRLHIPTAHEKRLSARQLRDAALGLLTDEYVKHFHSQPDAISWLEAPGTKVVLVWPEVRATPWMQSLSQRFHRELSFAQVQRTTESRALLDHYGISAVPTLAALTADHRKEEYTGPLEALQVQEWLLQLIAADHSSGAAGASGSQEAAEGEL